MNMVLKIQNGIAEQWKHKFRNNSEMQEPEIWHMEVNWNADFEYWKFKMVSEEQEGFSNKGRSMRVPPRGSI